MSDWQSAADDWLATLATQPAARQPATFAELGAVATDAGDISAVHLSNLAYEDLVAALHAETGQSAAEFTGNWGGSGLMPYAPVDRAQLIVEAFGGLDKEQRDRLAPLADVRKRAAEKAAAIEAASAAMETRVKPFGGATYGFLAGLSRQMLTPDNLALLAIGGPIKGPLLKVLGINAAIGGGIAAVEEPSLEADRAALGLAPGDFATNVASGALFAGGFAGVLRGAGFVLGRLGSRLPAEVRRLAPEDLAAAASVVERDAILADRAVPATPRGRAALPARIDAAAAAIERRAPRSEPLFPEIAIEAEAPRVQTYLGEDQIARPNGGALTVRPRVVELGDLTISHDAEGKANPNYPAEMQARDRSAAPSRTFIAEKASQLEPLRLGRSPTAQEGAPVVGPDGVVESGNGRALIIQRAYDRHPERAAAYRAFIESQGFSTEGMKHPVLVRGRETPVTDRAAFAREANVPSTAGLSTVERAFADAGRLGDDLLALRRGGETGSLGNVQFVRGFADRIVAPEERPNFVSADNRLSAEGATRIEAALVARGWGDKDIVAALYEERDPSSKAILGALADTAPVAARVKADIAAERLDARLDPTPAIVAGLRLVDRARATNQKVGDLLDQIDIELGAVPDAVKAAVRLFFRDNPNTGAPFFMAAGREVVAARLEKTLLAALDREKAVGDLFGFEASPATLLREGWTAETPADAIAIEGAVAEAAPPPQAPVAKTVTTTPEFKAWFRDSKVVGESGEPLIVYHGARGDFDTFSSAFFGENVSGEARDGFFFTSDPAEASGYAAGTAPGGAVMPVYLSLRNPLMLGYAEHGIDSVIRDDAAVAQLLARAQKEGRDGLLLQNIGGSDGATLYVAFEPQQIKSIANPGTFDPNNPSVIDAPPPGDPATRADAERALAEAGADFTIFLEETPGEEKAVAAATVLKEIEEAAAANSELLDCIGIASVGSAP